MMLAEHAKIPPAVHIHLHKVLPPGGGLGGGSSDAASTLLALNQLWKLEYDEKTLAGLAAQLGSDVPFFIASVPALCTGRGEVVTPLRPRHNLFAVLIVPTEGCPTKDVFQAFDTMLPEFAQPKIDWEMLATLPGNQLNFQLVNDLAPAAYKIAPWLGQLQQRARDIVHQPVHLTGSGSTLFTLTTSSMAAAGLQSLLVTALDKSLAIIATEIR
jgi:4-diphosphocytidyl-2-C-methyl-D-erythritol kinase